MRTTSFLHDLTTRVNALVATISTDLAPLDAPQLNYKPTPTQWSMLECLEHLNRYGRYYLPRLTRALARPSAPAAAFDHSWLGRRAIAAVEPANRKPQQTLARMNPNQSQLDASTVQEFLAQQQTLLGLLRQAPAADLKRKSIAVEFFRLLRLSSGDTLAFLVAHQERHVQQAGRVGQALRPSTPA